MSAKIVVKNVFDILKLSSLPKHEAYLILSSILNKPVEYLLAHPELNLPLRVFNKFALWEKKRLAGWPVAYLIGKKEFYGYDFQVSPAVLIPRPETEMIIDLVTDNWEKESYDQIIDIGTGSGAIVISLAKELKRLFPSKFKKIKFSAADISTRAISVAKKNADLNKISAYINFKRGHLLAPFLSDLKKSKKINLLITANLPYLTPKQIVASPSIQKEPKLALDGGRDGLDLYRQLFQQISKIPSAVSLTVIIEIDPIQSQAVVKLCKQKLKTKSAQILPDLTGKNRFAIIS